MGSAFHQLCPRYSGTLTPTAPTAIRLWDTFTFTYSFPDFFSEQDSDFLIRRFKSDPYFYPDIKLRMKLHKLLILHLLYVVLLNNTGVECNMYI